MFCPRCGVEYVEGVSDCADCGVPLVHERPPKRPDDGPLHWEPVLETFNQGDVTVARSLLDGEGITYFAEADDFNRVRPFVVPVRILVRPEEAGRAREILGDLDLAYGALDPPRGTRLEGVVHQGVAVLLFFWVLDYVVALLGLVMLFISLGFGLVLLAVAAALGAALYANRRARRLA